MNGSLFISFAAGFFGLILGSFFNVLIYRIPAGQSILWPGSQCPTCGRAIRAYENIPVFSFLFLGGKCAGCKAKISLCYPTTELITGATAFFLWQVHGASFFSQTRMWYEYIVFGLQLLSLLILIPVAVIDIKHYIIPDSISIGGFVVGILVSLPPGGLTPLQSLLGVLAGGGSLLAVGMIGHYIFHKEAMGFGDVKLMAFLGAFWGWRAALLGIVFASFLGSIAGGGLMLARVLPRDRHIPFGPFLAAGVIIAIFYGNELLQHYFSFVEGLFFPSLR